MRSPGAETMKSDKKARTITRPIAAARPRPEYVRMSGSSVTRALQAKTRSEAKRGAKKWVDPQRATLGSWCATNFRASPCSMITIRHVQYSLLRGHTLHASFDPLASAGYFYLFHQNSRTFRPATIVRWRSTLVIMSRRLHNVCFVLAIGG